MQLGSFQTSLPDEVRGDRLVEKFLGQYEARKRGPRQCSDGSRSQNPVARHLQDVLFPPEKGTGGLRGGSVTSLS